MSNATDILGRLSQKLDPDLVALLEDLGKNAKAAGEWNGLLIGDLSQPRGGPMLTGHASHQRR